jgi:Ca2+-binding RTX toxin-like protein
MLSRAAYHAANSIIPANWLEMKTITAAPSSCSIYRNDVTKAMVFAFKGTDSIKEITSDLVNDGGTRWQALKAGVIAYFKEVRELYPNYTFFSDGHSLGGGMAQTFALEMKIDGFGQNSLPISKSALALDFAGKNVGAELADYKAHHEFQEVNVRGDIATSHYMGGLYLDSAPQEVRHATIDPALSLALKMLKTANTGAQGQAYGAAVTMYGGMAHSIDAVIQALSGHAPANRSLALSSLAREDDGDVSADMEQAYELSGKPKGHMDTDGTVTFKSTTTTAAAKADEPTKVLLGDPLGGDGATLVLDPKESDGSVVTKTYIDGRIAGYEKLTFQTEGYTIDVMDPTNGTVVVHAQVNEDGSYVFTINGPAAVAAAEASPDFALPEWTDIPAFIASNFHDNNNTPQGSFYVDKGFGLLAAKTEWTRNEEGYTQRVFDQDGKLSAVAHLDAQGTVLDYSYFSMYYQRFVTFSSSFAVDDQVFFVKWDRPFVDHGKPGLTPLEMPGADGHQLNGDTFSSGSGSYYIAAPVARTAAKTLAAADSGETAPRYVQMADLEAGATTVTTRHGDKALQLTGTTMGDALTIQLDERGMASVDGVRFADGTVWSIAQMKSMLAGAATLNQVIGAGTGAVLVADQANNYVLTSGLAEAISIGANSARTEIEHPSMSDGLTVTWSATALLETHIVLAANGSDLHITNAHTGSVMVLDNVFQLAAGITLTFADKSVTLGELIAMSHVASASAETLKGSGQAEVFDGLGGGDLIQGGGGADTFVFKTGYGTLKIDAFDLSGADSELLMSEGISLRDLQVTASGGDLMISLADSADHVVLQHMLADAANGIARLRFSDGSEISRADLIAMAQKLPTMSADFDLVDGGSGADIIDGLGGGDRIHGNGGSDQYIYRPDYGFMEIEQRQRAPDDLTQLVIHATNPASVLIRADGADLLLYDEANTISILIKSILTDSAAGVQLVQFDDGTTWTRQQMLDSLLEATSDGETLTGSAADDIFHGLGGDDTYIGNGGNDVYEFNLGDGMLTIRQSNNAAGAHSVLKLGSGIALADVVVMARDDGISLRVNGHDAVLLEGMQTESRGDGVQEVVFADGTTWAAAALRQKQMESASQQDDLLSGTAAAETFDGKGGYDTYRSFGGGDTFVYQLGYNLKIEAYAVPHDKANSLQFGAGITGAMLSLAVNDQSLNVWIEGSGNINIVDMLGRNLNGVQRFVFDDGEIWDLPAILQRLMPSTAGDDNAVGTWRDDHYDGGGGRDTFTGGGGNDVIIFNKGYGLLVIDELQMANPVSPIAHSELRFGAGIRPEDIRVTAVADGHIMLAGATNDDLVVLQSMVRNVDGGVDAVHFENGVVWSRADLYDMLTIGTVGPDRLVGGSGAEVLDGLGGKDIADGGGGGDTFIFKKGYGQLEIIEIDRAEVPDNAVKLVGIEQGELSARFGQEGLLIHDATSGDEILIGNPAYIQRFVFDDGSTWDMARMLDLTSTGSAGGETLKAIEGRVQVIDGKGGGDWIIDYDALDDTFVFNQGYGELRLTVYNTDNTTLKLGGGIKASDLTFSWQDESLVIKDGHAGDVITVEGFKYYSWTGFNQLAFDDGSTQSREEIVKLIGLSAA